MDAGDDGFRQVSKLTRRAAFLAEMEQVVPWRELCAQATATAAPNRASARSRGLFRLRPNTLSTGLY
jgi:hypothetical protein